MRLLTGFLMLLLTSGLFAQQPANFKGVIKYEDYQNLINKNDQVLYVVNFWATWCSPCVKELPEFMEVNRQFSINKNFKMILVSLDNVRELESGLYPFMKENQIRPDVYLLDDIKRMNYWIPLIEKEWTGSIPATLIYKNGKKLFFDEKQLDQATLTQIINKFL
jgi:thiol-disulfide isomerase/thioredoxin